ncbi:hypothetical protein FH582_15955 [Leptospira interrogans]|uniref:hypothetical protein n=1 Tax=Leptospira interrogans TaxID=173 RepID=UPI001F116C88|nr:hypothetical protein [Leptospira interrogans]UMQ53422.1 hypothetical protein FH582_15955 [Leptospira interrogans]
MKMISEGRLGEFTLNLNSLSDLESSSITAKRGMFQVNAVNERAGIPKMQD